MAKLKNRNEFVPGGFQYLQAETGWEAPKDLSFNGIVSAIQAHRKGNPWLAQKHNWALDYDSVADEVDTYNANRMLTNPKYHGFIQEGGGGFADLPKFMSRPARAVAGVSGALKKTVAGINVLLNWLGDSGRPVELKEAERRAAICVVCPKNQKGDWKTWFTEAASAEILKVFGMMNDMRLKTSKDAELGVCSACLCPLRSKVWAPLPHILKELKPEVKAELHESCWITK